MINSKKEKIQEIIKEIKIMKKIFIQSKMKKANKLIKKNIKKKIKMIILNKRKKIIRKII